MKKPLLCLLLIAGSYLPIQAQTAPVATPTSTPKSALVAVPTGRQDTSQAIGNMFERRRSGGRRWLYFAAGGTLAFVRAATATPTSGSPYVQPSKPDPAGLALVFGVFAGLPAAIGVSKLVRFSEANEAAIDQAYRSSKRLPKSIERRLKTKDF